MNEEIWDNSVGSRYGNCCGDYVWVVRWEG